MSALKEKNNLRRLGFYMAISLVINLVLLFATSIGWLMRDKTPPKTDEQQAAEAAAAAAAAKPAANPAAKPEGDATKPSSEPPKVDKPKNAEDEFIKKQAGATDEQKAKANNVRPDLDDLK